MIGGTPDTAGNASTATVTVSDAAGNTAAPVSIAFPAVAKGAQVLSGFAYSAASVTFGSAAPAVTAPGGVETTLSYTATPATVCMVNPSSGALTLVGVGACVVTATAAGTPDYDAATAMFTVEVQAAGTLVLNLDADCRGRHGEHRGEGVGVRDLGRHRDRGRGERHGDDRRHAPERDLGRRQRDGDLVGERAGGCIVHRGHEPRPVGVGFEGRV